MRDKICGPQANCWKGIVWYDRLCIGLWWPFLFFQHFSSCWMENQNVLKSKWKMPTLLDLSAVQHGAGMITDGFTKWDKMQEAWNTTWNPFPTWNKIIQTILLNEWKQNSSGWSGWQRWLILLLHHLGVTCHVGLLQQIFWTFETSTCCPLPKVLLICDCCCLSQKDNDIEECWEPVIGWHQPSMTTIELFIGCYERCNLGIPGCRGQTIWGWIGNCQIAGTMAEFSPFCHCQNSSLCGDNRPRRLQLSEGKTLLSFQLLTQTTQHWQDVWQLKTTQPWRWKHLSALRVCGQVSQVERDSEKNGRFILDHPLWQSGAPKKGNLSSPPPKFIPTRLYSFKTWNNSNKTSMICLHAECLETCIIRKNKFQWVELDSLNQF